MKCIPLTHYSRVDTVWFGVPLYVKMQMRGFDANDLGEIFL